MCKPAREGEITVTKMLGHQSQMVVAIRIHLLLVTHYGQCWHGAPQSPPTHHPSQSIFEIRLILELDLWLEMAYRQGEQWDPVSHDETQA